MIAFDYNRCVGCGSCVRLCPMGYLKLEEKRPVVRERRRSSMTGTMEMSSVISSFPGRLFQILK